MSTARAGRQDRMALTPAGSPHFLSQRRPTDHDLTVVIPAFNEEARLPATLADLRRYLDDWGIDYRVQVVDDGSRDATAKVAATFGRRFSTLVQPQQRGKGAAVRAGMLQATGRVVAFTDADLPYELSALQSGFKTISTGQCDVVLGARDLHESEIRAHRKILRTIASGVFRHCMRLLVSRQVTDTQGGLKVYSRSAAIEIFSRATIDGFAFDAEVVFLTHQLGLQLQKVPVTLVNEYASTISLARHALPMLLDVVRVRWRNWQGAYHLDAPRREVLETESTARRAA